MAVLHLKSIRKAEEDLSRMLPTKAIDKGYQLKWIAAPKAMDFDCRLKWIPPEGTDPDPVVLIREGEELYRWEYLPSMGEVWEKVEELEGKEK